MLCVSTPQRSGQQPNSTPHADARLSASRYQLPSARASTRTLGAMARRPVIVLGILLSLAAITGCYRSADFVIVEPVRYVPVPPKPIPDGMYGWLRTTADKAERFKVVVGDLTYQRIIASHKVRGEITTEAAISAFADFAEAEVVKQRFCSAAFTPADARRLVGSNTPPKMWIFVRCAQ